MTTEELINNCKNNDRKAQASLYQFYAPKLFGICLKYSRNKVEAEDNLQDGFIKIFSKIDQYQHKGSFEGWMKRLMINLCLEKYRKNKDLYLVSDEIKDTVEVEVDEEDIKLDVLLTIIQTLPDRYRLVFNLYVLDGYSHKEIARMIHISEGTSKSNLSRARALLKVKLESVNKDQKTSNHGE